MVVGGSIIAESGRDGEGGGEGGAMIVAGAQHHTLPSQPGRICSTIEKV